MIQIEIPRPVLIHQRNGVGLTNTAPRTYPRVYKYVASPQQNRAKLPFRPSLPYLCIMFLCLTTKIRHLSLRLLSSKSSATQYESSQPAAGGHLQNNADEVNAPREHSLTHVLNDKGQDYDHHTGEPPPPYSSTPPEHLPQNDNSPAETGTSFQEILVLSQKEKAQYVSLHCGDETRSDILLYLSAKLGFQAFVSMTLYLLTRASAYELVPRHADFRWRVKNSFLKLNPDVIIALSAMACVVLGTPGGEFTNSNVLAYVDVFETNLGDLFEWDCQLEAVTIRKASSSFQVIQTALSSGPMSMILPYRGNLKKDLDIGLGAAWDVINELWI
ncbi:uncharacterized protein PV09_08047 [Verruconis gallopava]|uniref:Uncharacterized protein n=1 Tax=Verruconis gallopava TaxID=253628 RepID=A0A0D2AMH4_9PEZI|nr:uncharacterized protein PV09_08047 [Verruconis gallopava]KIW00334.1 hypothetical protein PV09_08047 [Verruconis gallopava]